jgi:hypothetical protein
MGLFKRAKQSGAAFGVARGALGAVADAGHLAAQVSHEHSGSIQAAEEMLNQPGHREAAQRTARIMNTGIPAVGTIQSTEVLSGETTRFVLALTEGPGAPRTLTFQQDVANLATYPVGHIQSVKIDPADPNDAMLWADLPTGEDIRISQLENLAQMHASGAIPDATYEMLKARMLGNP